MNPVLFKTKTRTFSDKFRPTYSHVLRKLEVAIVDSADDDFWTNDGIFDSIGYFPIEGFANAFETFLTENNLLKEEKIEFIRESQRRFKEWGVVLDSKHEKLNGGGTEDQFWTYLKGSAGINTIVKFLEHELTSLSGSSIKLTNSTKGDLDEGHNDENEIGNTGSITWVNKTELSELIYVLYHSKRILKNGIPIQQKELTALFNEIFNTDLKEPSDLLNKSVATFKRGEDGKTFINELNTLLEEYHNKKRGKP